MSLQWQISRQVPADTGLLGQMLFAPENPYRQLGDRFDALFPDEVVFAPLYDTSGRGAIPPLLLSLVTVFQMWEKVPDRLAAECVVSRLDWKYALHLPLTYTGFHFTDLSAFRARLLAHEAERLLFDRLVATLKEQGLIKEHGQMRTDSSHVLAVVERLGRWELVTESIRLALAAVTALVPTWVEATLPPAFQEAYATRQSEYGLAAAEVARRLTKAGQDGFWFLTQWDRAVPVPLPAVPEAITTLRTVLQQQFPQGHGSPPRSQRPSGRDVIDSPHEPQARSHTKRTTSWIGYKVQVTETCDDTQPHLLTDVDITAAFENDSPQLPAIQARLAAQGTVPAEQYVDQGYMSGANLVSSRDKGITLMGKPLADTQGPPGFQQTDFIIDEPGRQATCPARQTSRYWQEEAAPPGGQPPVDLRFAGATCRACPFFGRCTTSGRGRSLALHPYRQALAARRQEAETESFGRQMHRRAGVEGTIAELTRRLGLRQARYRGTRKVRLQALLSGVAANLRRVTAWWGQAETVSTLVATT